MAQRITIQDVANHAGVSIATVSRVLNGNSKVNEGIRQRVSNSMMSLGYQPNRAARRLRTRSRDVIGVIISDIQNPYFTSVIRGIEDAAYDHGVNIVLCNTDEDPIKLQRYLRVMQAEEVAGLIIAPLQNHQNILEQFQEDGTPIVFIDRSDSSTSAVDLVRVDNLHGAYTATKHLIGLGYERIGIIHPTISTGYERCQGYRQALQEAHIPVDESLVRRTNHTANSAYHEAVELVKHPQRPQAIFTTTGLITLGALQALRHHNVAVPEEMALIGFDDVDWAEVLYSPLTAVRQPTYRLGQEAVRMLIDRLDNPQDSFTTITLPTELVIRESCGSQLSKIVEVLA